jgi:hypothetical protein
VVVLGTNAGAVVPAARNHLRLGTSGALLSSDDYGSSVERTAKLHPLWQALRKREASEWWSWAVQDLWHWIDGRQGLMWYVPSALSSRRRPGGFTFLVDPRLERDPPLTNAATCRPAALPPAPDAPVQAAGTHGAQRPRPSAGAPVPTSRRARPSGGRRNQPVRREKAPQRPVRGCRRRRSEPASRHRTYGANPLSIQVRKRWTLSAGHGP